MKKLITFLAFFCIYFSINGQAPISFSSEEGTKEVMKRMKELGIPGLSIAIIKDLEVHRIDQWGSLSQLGEKDVNENTLFQAGSLSGGLTAILTLQAVEEGEIELEEDINQYLKSWKLPVNKFNKNDPVTILDLLTKRRGFTQNQKPKGYTQGEKLPSFLEVLNGSGTANTKAIKLRSATHTQENYSFETEVILQQILTDVYGQPFRTLVQSRILNRLGMDHSTFNLQLNEQQIQQAAKGYSQQGIPVSDGWMIYPEAGSAGLWTTAADYSKLTLELLKAYQGKENILLSQEMTRRALAKANAHSNKAMLFNAWGNGSYFGYGGAPIGYYATMEANPEAGWSIVILTNKHLQWKFVNELKASLREMYQLK